MKSFRFTKQNVEGNCYKVFGKLDEFSSFPELNLNSDSVLKLDFSEIYNFNTSGIRTWVGYRDGLVEGVQIVYENCSVSIVECLNLTNQFIGSNSIVSSFFAPFYCKDCGIQDRVLLTIDENFDPNIKKPMESFHCSLCEKEMSPDFKEDEYYGFLEYLNSDINIFDEDSSNEKKTIQTRKPLLTKIFLPDANNEYHGTPVTTFTENISAGGLFICSFHSYPLGTQMKVDFHIPTNGDETYHLETLVEVKWERTADPAKNILQGFGVEFINLTAKEQDIINNYLASFQAKS